MSTDTNAKDAYGREYMPTETTKKYFSPFFPFKVFLFTWMWLLRWNFYKFWSKLAAETESDTGLFIFGFFVGIAFFSISTFPIMLIGHYAFTLLGLNGIVVYMLGVLINLFSYFAFHLHTEEGYQYWKDKLLRTEI